jgi:enoyl-CoA hydratase
MPYAPTPYLLVDADGPVTIVTINNPDMRNAFIDEVHEGMQEIWGHLSADPSVRAVVLTGAGKAFSAGGNVPGFIRDYEDPEHRRRSLRGAKRLMDAMAEFPKPVVAAVNGPAVGLGCSVAVSCDLVLIAESAYIADTHVSIGLVCGDGGAVAWPLMMSLLKAKEYLLTGDRIPAGEAVALGLANRVVPDDRLLAEAVALAQHLAAQPPQAVQETKRALNLHLQAAINLVAPFALSAEAESFATDDIRRTIENFKKKD